LARVRVFFNLKVEHLNQQNPNKLIVLSVR
jgi:hypothetical protein